MKHIKKYDQFNEEIDIRRALVGGAIGVAAVAASAGVYDVVKNYDKAGLNKKEVVCGKNFKDYDLDAKGESFTLHMSDDGVICSEWETTSSDGKTTQTTSHNCITVPDDTKEIWYHSKFFGGLFASTKPLSGGKHISLSDMTLKKETSTYTVYAGKFFSTINYVVVNKGHKKGEEFTISDDKIHATYVCDDIGWNVYIFGVKSLGGGQFGGSGAGSKY